MLLSQLILAFYITKKVNYLLPDCLISQGLALFHGYQIAAAVVPAVVLSVEEVQALIVLLVAVVPAVLAADWLH